MSIIAGILVPVLATALGGTAMETAKSAQNEAAMIIAQADSADEGDQTAARRDKRTRSAGSGTASRKLRKDLILIGVVR